MAIPDNIGSISTNVGMIELQEVCDALRKTSKPEIHWIGQPMLFCEQCEAKFMFRGRTYVLLESYEMVVSIMRRD